MRLKKIISVRLPLAYNTCIRSYTIDLYIIILKVNIINYYKRLMYHVTAKLSRKWKK